jgi:prophage maintenance system killer protein
MEDGGAFSGILGAIEQTLDGQDLFPSTQEEAANLFYFVVKDHPFSDGNKRSAAALVTNYLHRTALSYNARDGITGDTTRL